jgi:hypothetical protein|tara:strand:+ start:521 stop:694 length:174 start_codon:yes stop_codon:yes gene_type:complete
MAMLTKLLNDLKALLGGFKVKIQAKSKAALALIKAELAIFKARLKGLKGKLRALVRD